MIIAGFHALSRGRFPIADEYLFVATNGKVVPVKESIQNRSTFFTVKLGVGPGKTVKMGGEGGRLPAFSEKATKGRVEKNRKI